MKTRFNPPTNRAFIIALGLAALSVACRYFVGIPYVSDYTYELMTAAYGVMLLACIFRGL